MSIGDGTNQLNGLRLSGYLGSLEEENRRLRAENAELREALDKPKTIGNDAAIGYWRIIDLATAK